MSNHFDINKHLRLMSILRYESSQPEIGRLLNISKQAVSSRIKRLLREGYITIQVKSKPITYNLTQEGNRALREAENQNVDFPSRTGAQKLDLAEKFSDMQRLHATRFRIPHAQRRPKHIKDTIFDFKDYPVRSMNHWDQIVIDDFADFDALVNTRYTEIRGIQVKRGLEHSTDDLVFEAHSKFKPFLEGLERIIARRIPGFRFLRDERGVIVTEFTKKEIAHEGDAAAQRYYQKGNEWKVLDPGDRKERWKIDDSPEKKTIHDIEAVHEEKALSDNEALRKFKLDVGPEEYQRLIEDIGRKALGSWLNDLGDEKWNHRAEQQRLTNLVSVVAEFIGAVKLSQDQQDQLRADVNALVHYIQPGGYSQ